MEFDCRACGACCFGTTSRYVPVTGDDHLRIGADASSWTRFAGVKCFMAMTGDRCAALKHTVEGFTCSLYERRPAICRELEPGSPECLAERERKWTLVECSGLRPTPEGDG